MTKERKLTGSFVALDESGTEHNVSIITEYHTIQDRGGEDRSEGMKSLKLDDGRPLNRINHGRYETVNGPKLKLTSTDPTAP